MSNMKCPFCQQELKISGDELNDLELYCDKCEPFMAGNEELWQELTRTRKALAVAKDTIRHTDWFFDGDYNVDAKTMHSEIKCAIKGITALEQKDK